MNLNEYPLVSMSLKKTQWVSMSNNESEKDLDRPRRTPKEPLEAWGRPTEPQGAAWLILLDRQGAYLLMN